MAQIIEMTQLSPTMTEGILVEWLKNEGDLIQIGDLIAATETDKAVMELEAFDEGTLVKKLVEVGQHLPVGSPIAILASGSEDITEIEKQAKDKLARLLNESSTNELNYDDNTIDKTDVPTSNEVELQVEQSSIQESDENSIQKTLLKQTIRVHENTHNENNIKASPLAKTLAKQYNIDLSQVKPSGPNGRIIRDDVEQARKSFNAGGSQVNFTQQRQTDRIEKISMMRQTIAKRLTDSKSHVPHFYLSIDVNINKLIKLRQNLNHGLTNSEFSHLDFQKKISLNDFIIRACALALKEHPEVNAQWNGDSIIYKGNVDVGFAVAIEEGLLTPIIRNADSQNIHQISTAATTLAQKARKRKLTQPEFTNGSFTISNLGMFGIKSFQAIINAPEAALLAIGSASKKKIYHDEKEKFVTASVMNITLSCDHRVVDGAKGATFLNSIKYFLENPSLLL